MLLPDVSRAFLTIGSKSDLSGVDRAHESSKNIAVSTPPYRWAKGGWKISPDNDVINAYA